MTRMSEKERNICVGYKTRTNPKYRVSILVFIAYSLLSSVAMAQTIQTNTLDSYRSIRDSALVKIADDTKKKNEDALVQYAKALDAIQAALKQKGDIDSFPVVDAERKRFQSEKTVTTNTPPVEFAVAVQSYRKQIQDALADRDSQKIDLQKRYIAALNNLIKELMVRNKMEDAKVAGDEKKKAEAMLAGMGPLTKVEVTESVSTGMVSRQSTADGQTLPVKTISKPGLTILKATYGPPGSGLDFTDKVRQLVRNNRLEIPGGHNNNFGDVAPHKSKVLILEYTEGTGTTNVIHKEYGENDPVVISMSPKHEKPADNTRGLFDKNMVGKWRIQYNNGHWREIQIDTRGNVTVTASSFGSQGLTFTLKYDVHDKNWISSSNDMGTTESYAISGGTINVNRYYAGNPPVGINTGVGSKYGENDPVISISSNNVKSANQMLGLPDIRKMGKWKR